MHYLRKTPDSGVITARWRYPKDAAAIRKALLKEQHRFCAYSERFVQATDSCDVEHFDPRLKGTEGDSSALTAELGLDLASNMSP